MDAVVTERDTDGPHTYFIDRLSSKANAIRAYVRILIRLLNNHWLIGFRALTALKIV